MCSTRFPKIIIFPTTLHVEFGYLKNDCISLPMLTAIINNCNLSTRNSTHSVPKSLMMLKKKRRKKSKKLQTAQVPTDKWMKPFCLFFSWSAPSHLCVFVFVFCFFSPVLLGVFTLFIHQSQKMPSMKSSSK